MFRRIILIIFLIFSSFTVTSAFAASSFYKGKTLTIIVPTSPGGSYDTWARLIAPRMRERLDLARVEVVNRPGGGGLIGTNALYNATADGLTIGNTNTAGDLYAQILKNPAVDYDIRKFGWIGQPSKDPHLVITPKASPYKRFGDLMALKGQNTPIAVLAPGAVTTAAYSSSMVYNAFDIPHRMVTGFQGTHGALSTFIAGQGDVMQIGLAHLDGIKDQVTPLLLVSDQRFQDLPDVPTLIEVAKNSGLPEDKLSVLTQMARTRGLGHDFAAPPGVPERRMQQLRAAFKAALEDERLQRSATKSGEYVEYKSPAVIAGFVDESLAHASEFKRLIKGESGQD